MNSQILSKKCTTLVVVTASGGQFVCSRANNRGRPSSLDIPVIERDAGRQIRCDQRPRLSPVVPRPRRWFERPRGVMTLDGAGNVSFEVTIGETARFPDKFSSVRPPSRLIVRGSLIPSPLICHSRYQ
jgi:hypothetical protein